MSGNWNFFLSFYHESNFFTMFLDSTLYKRIVYFNFCHNFGYHFFICTNLVTMYLFLFFSRITEKPQRIVTRERKIPRKMYINSSLCEYIRIENFLYSIYFSFFSRIILQTIRHSGQRRIF